MECGLHTAVFHHHRSWPGVSIWAALQAGSVHKAEAQTCGLSLLRQEVGLAIVRGIGNTGAVRPCRGTLQRNRSQQEVCSDTLPGLRCGVDLWL